MAQGGGLGDGGEKHVVAGTAEIGDYERPAKPLIGRGKVGPLVKPGEGPLDRIGSLVVDDREGRVHHRIKSQRHAQVGHLVAEIDDTARDTKLVVLGAHGRPIEFDLEVPASVR